MGIYKKSTANIILNSKRRNAFPKIRNKRRMFALAISMQHYARDSNQAIRKEKDIKSTD